MVFSPLLRYKDSINLAFIIKNLIYVSLLLYKITFQLIINLLYSYVKVLFYW